MLLLVLTDLPNQKHNIMASLSKQELQAIVDKSQILIWRANTETLCDYFNEAWLNFTGRTFEQEYGNGWAEGVHPDDFDRCLKIYLDNFHARLPFEMRYRLKRHDGKYRWIYDKGVPYFDSENNFLGYIGSCFDIHEQKLMEEQLINAKIKAEESDKLKTAFLANMSHEIRTPLNAILGFSDLLKRKNLSDEKRDNFLHHIKSGGQRLLRIISDIIDIAKIEVNQLSLNYENCNLNELLDCLKNQFEINELNKGCKIKLIKDFEDSESNIYIDKIRLSQIISNLLENALKFTKNGEISFGYTLKIGMLEFFVKDNGIGISDKDRKNIFNKFFQADNNYTLETSGTGLGLSIVKNLTHLLNGDVWVKSKEGSGSTFYFTIPHINGNISKAEDNSLDKILSQESIFRDKFTILIAEDEYLNYMYLENLMSNYPHKIIHAKNGKEAVKAVKNNKSIDVILIDINMPIMDGYKALKEIKNINKQLPAIALTAYALTKDKEKALKAGFNDYLSKPVNEKELMHTIDKVINENVY